VAALLFQLNPKWPLGPVQIYLIVGILARLVLEGVASYVKIIRPARMPTSKRKMNRKWWKQP